ncbi:MAG: 4Fe-4S dicluster domain-containing protein, partial [Armatimonadetes bacterium]|nr:4Fe-4S dicluster domain-containing protein [Armatimonadota bacterium]
MSDRERTPKAIAEIARSACIGCEQCVPVCPTEAITMDAEGIAVVDASGCIGCRECVEVCPAAAIAMSGEKPAAEVPREEKEAEPATTSETSREVWVFVEHTDGRPASVSWELLGKGAELARDLGGRVCAAILDREVERLVKEAAAYGAERAYVIDNPALAHYSTAPYLRGLVRL